jgi:cation diffusion facilitator CzcD-associated flavoprotein CzcO
MEHVDVLIVGAGLSGIGAAHHLQDELPGKTYAILEARDASGGTWDLFRYPGVRSDSDMHTLGYRFRPWVDRKAIADGPAILSYVRATASDAGIDRHIRYGHKVVRAEWSTPRARWTVHAEHAGEEVVIEADFLFCCGGYYNYDAGFTPQFEGIERFAGTVVHPQFWPEDLDYAGKRVVVIGSGATAVTLVPAMAGDAAHVTMLQRSPSYIISLPDEDPIANGLRRVLPDKVAYFLTRWKNVGLQTLTYRLSRRRPHFVRGLLRRLAVRALPEGYDVDTHFKPAYDPWDQRMCLIPNGDLFEAISSGDASIVTDQIETFTERGLLLASGDELEADVVVTATGLNMLAFGGVQLAVDGEDVALPETMAYKAIMLGGVPNFAFTMGYTNASWTLKADLVSEYVCRLLRHMDANGYRQVVPQPNPAVEAHLFIEDFTSGYVQRAIDQWPRQGSVAPWRLKMSYARDLVSIRHGAIDDGTLAFSSPARVDERVAA